MTKVAIMFDFDGTIFDTMGKHADLAAKCIQKHFGMSFRQARNEYLSTTGIPFPEQLKKIFPKAHSSLRKNCVAEYVERKITEVYGAAKPFKDVEAALKALKAKGYDLIISSSTEAPLIKNQLEKHGLTKYFSDVFGPKKGNKAAHIGIIRIKRQNPRVIAFVGDSASDVSLRKKGAGQEVFTIGRTGRKKQGMHGRKNLRQAGATFTTIDLRHITDIDFEKALSKASKGKRYRRGPIRTAKMLGRHLRRK